MESSADLVDVWQGQNPTQEEQHHVSAFIEWIDQFPIMRRRDVQTILRNRHSISSILFGYILCIGGFITPGSSIFHKHDYLSSLMNSDFENHDVDLFIQFHILKATLYGFHGYVPQSFAHINMALKKIKTLTSHQRFYIVGAMSITKGIWSDSMHQRFIYDVYITIPPPPRCSSYAEVLLMSEWKELRKIKPRCCCGMPNLLESKRIREQQDLETPPRNAQIYISSMLPTLNHIRGQLLPGEIGPPVGNCYPKHAIEWAIEFLDTTRCLSHYDRISHFWRECDFICRLADLCIYGTLEMYLDLEHLTYLLNTAFTWNSQHLRISRFEKKLQDASNKLTAYIGRKQH